MRIARHVVSGVMMASAVAVAVAAPACGKIEPSNMDTGEPPDPSKFGNGPGKDGKGDGYGYGSDSSGPAPFVCPDEAKRCAHTFTYPANANDSAVELRGDFGGDETWNVGVKMELNQRRNEWSVDVDIPFGKPVQYKFYVRSAEGGDPWRPDPAQPTVEVPGENGGTSINNIFEGKTCEPAICGGEDGKLPDGVFDWRDSVIYFVFVDRFLDANKSNNCNVQFKNEIHELKDVLPIANYQGGDWAGVTSKIKDGYFNSLGVNTLWITVPFENPLDAGLGTDGKNWFSASHGYWPKLDNTDPTKLQYEACFGTPEDLKSLVREAHKNNLKVLFDYAMVHVHSESNVYKQNKSWFWGANEGGCVCGSDAGCGWEEKAKTCWFTSYLPHWNYTNSSARAYAVTQAVKWVTETGVDGFRADAIKHIDDSWLKDLRAKLKTEVHARQNPVQRFYMVGETYEFGNRDLLKAYIDPATKLDGQFDFPLRKYLVNSLILRNQSMRELDGFLSSGEKPNDYFYGPKAVMSTFIGNHDLPRVIHLAQNNPVWSEQSADGKDRAWSNQPTAVNDLSAFERVANGFGVLFTLKGAPLIYYGDEVGLAGAGDPDNRRFMQWSNYNAGQSYLLDRIKKLGTIRSQHPALRRGRRATLEVSDDLWVFSRSSAEETVYVAVNRSDIPQRTKTPELPGAMTELIEGKQVSGPSVSIPPRQTRIFIRR